MPSACAMTIPQAYRTPLTTKVKTSSLHNAKGDALMQAPLVFLISKTSTILLAVSFSFSFAATKVSERIGDLQICCSGLPVDQTEVCPDMRYVL